jgi:hypothetical protein
MDRYVLDLTDCFGKTRRAGEIYTGPTARKDAQVMARYVRAEMYRNGYEDGDRRRIVGVRVVPYTGQG